jgi:hypothetical protein
MAVLLGTIGSNKKKIPIFTFSIYLVKGIDDSVFVKSENVKRSTLTSAKDFIMEKYSYQKTGKTYNIFYRK